MDHMTNHVTQSKDHVIIKNLLLTVLAERML